MDGAGGVGAGAGCREAVAGADEVDLVSGTGTMLISGSWALWQKNQ